MIRTLKDWATEPRFGWSVTAALTASAQGVWTLDWLIFGTAASAAIAALYAAVDKTKTKSTDHGHLDDPPE